MKIYELLFGFLSIVSFILAFKIPDRVYQILAIFAGVTILIVVYLNAKLFEEKIRAKIIIEHNKGHFSGSDGIRQLPIILDEILKMAGEK